MTAETGSVLLRDELKLSVSATRQPPPPPLLLLMMMIVVVVVGCSVLKGCVDKGKKNNGSIRAARMRFLGASCSVKVDRKELGELNLLQVSGMSLLGQVNWLLVQVCLVVRPS